MKSQIAAATVLILLLSFVPSSAQTRTRRSSPQRRRPSAATTQLDATRTNAARLQLASLNKDLTRFLYVYGRLSKDLELTEAQTESADVAAKTRAGLIDSLRTMSNRLDQIEREFRFNTGLERFYRSLQGVSARAAQAESAASAGRFDQAGRMLVDIAGTLTDVLLEM